MNIQNLHVKHIIDDIIDVAYGEETEEKRKEYKGFQFFILPKQRSSVSGYYYPKEQKIEVFNVSKHGDVSAVKTSLHEVAHHLDQCINGSTGHQKSFYEEYKKIIYAALNMQIILPEELKSDTAHNDSNKVAKIVDAWIPSYVPYAEEQAGKYVAYAKENYYTKELLKNNGYTRCDGTIYWRKDISEEERDKESQFLESSHSQYEIKEVIQFQIHDAYITVSPDTKEQVERLKELGFRLKKDAFRTVWVKNVLQRDCSKMLLELKQDEYLNKLSFHIEKIKGK